MGDKGTPEIRERIQQVRADLFAAFSHDDTYELADINATCLDGKLHFLLEIVGPEVFPDHKLENLEAQLAKKFQEPMAIYVWSRIEMVYGPDGRISLGKLHEYFNKRQRENLPEEVPLMLETFNR